MRLALGPEGLPDANAVANGGEMRRPQTIIADPLHPLDIKITGGVVVQTQSRVQVAQASI